MLPIRRRRRGWGGSDGGREDADPDGGDAGGDGGVGGGGGGGGRPQGDLGEGPGRLHQEALRPGARAQLALRRRPQLRLLDLPPAQPLHLPLRRQGRHPSLQVRLNQSHHLIHPSKYFSIGTNRRQDSSTLLVGKIDSVTQSRVNIDSWGRMR